MQVGPFKTMYELLQTFKILGTKVIIWISWSVSYMRKSFIVIELLLKHCSPIFAFCGIHFVFFIQSFYVVLMSTLHVISMHFLYFSVCFLCLVGLRQANSVLIAYAGREGSGEPALPRSLAKTSAARSNKQWVKRNLQTESQIPGPSEWLGIRSLYCLVYNHIYWSFYYRNDLKFLDIQVWAKSVDKDQIV